MLRWTVLVVAIVLTVVSGLDYVLRALRLRQAATAPGGRAVLSLFALGGHAPPIAHRRISVP